MPSTASRNTRRIEALWKKLVRNRSREGAEEPSALPHGGGLVSNHGSVSRWLGSWYDRAAAALHGLTAARCPLVLPKALRAHPRLLILCAVSLVCLCAILGWWVRRPRADSADFNLHAENSCSNLDNTSAEESDNAARRPPQPTVVEINPLEPATLMPPAPVVQVVKTEESSPGLTLPPPPMPETKWPVDVPPPSKLEVPPPEPPELTEPDPVAPLPPPTRAEPDVSDPLQDWHRGDIPMMRKWHKIIGYQAFLAAAMFAAPAVADDSDKKKGDEGAKIDWKTIKDQLDSIEGKIKGLDTITSQIDGLRKDIGLLRQANTGDFAAINKRVADMEEKLKSLETRLNQAATRIARFPPTNGTPPTGRLRLVNSFNRNATVFLNDMAHRLEPGRTVEVNLPAGPYNFWVAVDGFAMVQPPTTGTLTAGASRTIEIYNR